MTQQEIRLFQKRLLTWYRKNARSLPWRKTKDPYRIWLSEIMLQQTQVDQAIPYYERFLKKFPTVQRLAQAPLTRVLDSWSGLGYYSRAKNLHAAAQLVCREYAGALPSEVADLLKLPGIGRYTAGAVASIAFDRPAPILDGNVIRVLSRYLAIEADPRQPAMQKRLWQVAGQLVSEKLAGDFNQALMECGALICTPRQPACARCPLKSGCLAFRRNLQELIPPTRIQLARKEIPYVCGIIENAAGAVLIARRPLEGLLPGLWEFPGGEKKPNEPARQALTRLLRERLHLSAAAGQPLGKITQLLSHRRLTIQAFTCSIDGKPLTQSSVYLETRWVRKQDLQKVAFTAGMLAISKIKKRLDEAELTKAL